MQSALSPREILALSSWRTFQQNAQTRPKSTLPREESKGLSENVFASAILHGNHNPQNPNPQSETRLHGLSRQLQLEETFKLYGDPSKENKGLRTPGTDSKMLKGRNLNPLRARTPSRGRRAEAKERPLLKDEDYIKNTMEIPSAADYPDVPPELFTNPKQGVHNALQSIADFKPKLIPIRGSALRCTLRCRFRSTAPVKVETEVVFGEGTNKVIILLFYQTDIQLTLYRNLPRRLHILICWLGIMRLV